MRMTPVIAVVISGTLVFESREALVRQQPHVPEEPLAPLSSSLISKVINETTASITFGGTLMISVYDGASTEVVEVSRPS